VRNHTTAAEVDDDRREMGAMGASPSDPDGSGFLTPRERKILAHIEHELAASDALLDVALTDGVRPLPQWLIWTGRAALLLMPLVLLLPFTWWSSIPALAAVLIVFMLRSGRRSGHGAGRQRTEPRGWPRTSF
jgi:hypothetical protein